MVGQIEGLLKKYDALLLARDANTFYLTRFRSSFCFVLLCGKKKFFLTDMRYANEAQDCIGASFEVKCITPDIYKNIAQILKSHNCKSVGFDNVSAKEYIAYTKELSDFDFFECENELTKIRSIKSDEEIVLIKSAQKIAESSLRDVLNDIKEGVSEAEVAYNLEYLMRKGGAEATSFDTIVAFSENSANPHSRISNKRLRYGDNILIDFGCKVNGYCSDMTRTFAYGRASLEFIEVYKIVKAASDAALLAINNGVYCGMLDKTARSLIEKHGFGKEFCHSLGHGVGIEVHEQPSITSNEAFYSQILQTGMIITIEPGIYIKNKFGVRIEDMVAITSDGFENLTDFDKNLIII